MNKSKCCNRPANSHLDKTGKRYATCSKCGRKCSVIVNPTPPTSTEKPYHYEIDKDGNAKQLNEIKSPWKPPTTTVEEIKRCFYRQDAHYPHVEVELVDPVYITDEVIRNITRLIQEAELQARANAYYEAADLFSDRPEIYKILWDKRQEVLAQLKGGTTNEE